MAEARGKAQAESLRKTKTDTIANRVCRSGQIEKVASSKLRAGDVVIVSAGEVIPGDGEVIDGIATVDESVITGESAPVIRESGGDRSAVTGGTRVLSDQMKISITSNPGRDVPRSHDCARRGRRASEDAQRDRVEHPDRRPDDHLPARRGDAGALRPLQRQRRRRRHTADHRRLCVAARLPDSDDDRRPALGDRHRRHGSRDAAQRARDERQGRRGRRRRQHAAARQNGHHHARQPASGRVRAGQRRHRGRPGGRGTVVQPGRRNTGRALDRRAGEGKVWPSRPRHGRAQREVPSRSRRTHA